MAGYTICPAQPLEEFVRQVLVAMGADQDIATEVARHLVRANLSGHDSHGVTQIPNYVVQSDAGVIVPSARAVFLREAGATALIDARRGFGHYSTAFALDWAMEHARRHGVAAVAVRHSTHIGRLGEYAERAGERGLIAILTVGAGGEGVGAMVLHGSRARFFGTNPWSIGIPATGRPPLVFDAAASMVAEGKVRVAHAKGMQVPPGCIVDAEGRPTTDPADFIDGGALLPLGGKAAGHKGYGLAFASMLLGALGMIDDPDPTLIGAMVRGKVAGRVAAGLFLAVVDPGFFGDAQHYEEMVAGMMAEAKRMPPAAGVLEVLLPGEPEVRTRERLLREGIALPEPTWRELAKVAERFDVPLPEHQPSHQ